MATKRLTKALRGKRRWVGIEVSANIDSRESLEKVLSSITGFPKGWKLFDFIKGEPGHAILMIPLENLKVSRELLSYERRASNGLVSVTTSGKIRLVRERLNLPKPKRKRVR